jgi:U5 small nuclear ribonucleoprotein component
VLVVAVLEGVMLGTERAVKHALSEKLKLVVVLSKIDRLILELKLPPNDAYYKIKSVLEDISALVESAAKSIGEEPVELSPANGNVCFASGLFGWSFTLGQFAKQYAQHYGGGFPPDEFAKRLWGDIYFDKSTRRFKRKPIDSESRRTFVQFVLEPIYKIYGNVVGEHTENLQTVLAEVGIKLSRKQLKLDAKPLLKLVSQKFFGAASGFVDMCVAHIPSPADKEAALTKVANTYTGDHSGELYDAMSSCDAEGPLMINVSAPPVYQTNFVHPWVSHDKLYMLRQVTKLYHNHDCSAFNAVGRVMSGTVRTGDRVKVLGEGYSADDEEDMALQEVEKVGVLQVWK